MFRGKNKAEWDQTSWMLSTIANVMRDPKNATTPNDFNPYSREKKKKTKIKADISVLKCFVKDKK